MTKNRKLCADFHWFQNFPKFSVLRFRLVFYCGFDFRHICFSVCFKVCVFSFQNRVFDLSMWMGFCVCVCVFVREFCFIKIFFTRFFVTMIRRFLEEKSWNSKRVFVEFILFYLCVYVWVVRRKRVRKVVNVRSEFECVGVRVHSIASVASAV